MDTTTLIQTILIGIIQGLTEFIPVSSSGHLEIVPKLFGWSEPTTSMILFAHLGTLLSLLLYFRKDIFRFVKSAIVIIRKDSKSMTKQVKEDWDLVLRVIVATIPAGILGLLTSQSIEYFYDNPEFSRISNYITLAAMAILGVVFILSDNWFKQKKVSFSKLSFVNSGLIGASQAIAFIRGTSRSGISLLSGQFFGLNRVDAARFSFLISIPLITAASILSIIEFLSLPAEEMRAQAPVAGIILISSFASGLIAVHYLLKYLQKHGLSAFGWYRVIFALLALLVLAS